MLEGVTLNNSAKNARLFRFNTFLGSLCRLALRAELFRLEHHYSQRRQSNPRAGRLAVRGRILGLDPPSVAHVAAPEYIRVAVKNLPVSAQSWKSDPVARPRDRREVAAKNQK